MSSLPADSPSTREHAVHLRLAQPWRGSVAGAASRLLGDDGGWLGRPVATPPGGAWRRYEADIELPVREQAPHMVLRKAALVDLGSSVGDESGLSIEVSWRSATLAPLFPVFVGRLEVTTTDLVLEGFYAPPGGEVGVILDRALLNIAARGTARWFLARVAATLGGSGSDA